jgi:hypothetical protein
MVRDRQETVLAIFAPDRTQVALAENAIISSWETGEESKGSALSIRAPVTAAFVLWEGLERPQMSCLSLQIT